MGIEFTETMKGYFAKGVTDKNDYQLGYDRGKGENSPFEFTLTVISEDVDDMITNPEHEAKMLGSVIAPALSADPLTVNGGIFHLFTVDPEVVGARQMRYSCLLYTSPSPRDLSTSRMPSSA